MKKFIINICLITILFGAVNALYLLLLYYEDISFIKRHESMHFNKPDYELLVIGNSLATDAFDTELLTDKGISSYNLAIPGSSVKTSYIQLNEYLTKYTKTPKYVILGMGSYTGTFEDETIHPIVEFTAENYRYKIRDLPMMKFRWLAIELMKKMVSSHERSVKVSHGQFKFQKVQTDNTRYTNNVFEIDRYRKSFNIHKIATLCNTNNIELILIELPGFKEVQNISETGPHLLTYSDGSTATLYNFNNIKFGKLLDAKKHWIGNSHLNEFGATIFTEKMHHTIFNN